MLHKKVQHCFYNSLYILHEIYINYMCVRSICRVDRIDNDGSIFRVIFMDLHGYIQSRFIYCK